MSLEASLAAYKRRLINAGATEKMADMVLTEMTCDYVAKCVEDESWLDRVKHNPYLREDGALFAN